MKILSVIVKIMTFFFGIFEKKIEVSSKAESVLQEIKNIYDNRAGIIAGTYTVKLTGSPEWDAMILMVVRFVEKYGETNDALVADEIKTVIAELQPLVDQFVSDTQAVNQPAPAESQFNNPAKTAPAPAATKAKGFLGTAIQFIENILGQSKSESTPAMRAVTTNAETASSGIQAHVQAIEAEPKFPLTMLSKQVVPALDAVMKTIKDEPASPTNQSIFDNANLAKASVMAHITEAAGTASK